MSGMILQLHVFKAGNVREIVLSSVSRSTFFAILHFMYTSALHIFKENVHDILITARKLQISSIVEVILSTEA